MILRLNATLVVFTLIWGLGGEAVNFGTGSSRLEDNAEAAADFNKIVEDTEWVEQSTNPWMKTNIALLDLNIDDYFYFSGCEVCT